MRVENTHTSMNGYVFLGMPSSVALRSVEMQMQFVTGHDIPLLSVPAGQGNNDGVDKV
jgi:hypothetical protein